MKHLFIIFVFCVPSLLFAHGGDDGPSSLETEFAKLSHLHAPMNFNTHHGLEFGYELPGQHEEEASPEPEGIELNFHPVFFGGYDKLMRLVCLEKSEAGLENCAENSSYLLLENKKWELGLGAEVDFHLPIPSFGVGMGVSYLKGKNYVSGRVLNSKFEKRSPLALPFTQEEFSNWKVGDQLLYMSKSSVIFNAFVGMEPFFHLGPEYMHTGIQRVAVQKTGASELMVEVVLSKSNGVGVEANAVILNSEGSLSSSSSKTFRYDFDDLGKEDFEVIKAIFAGRLDIANEKLLFSQGKITLRSDISNKGVSVSGSFGIPALYFNGKSSGRYKSQGKMEEVHEEQMEQFHVFSATRQTDHFTRGVLSKHMWKLKSSMATIIQDENHSDESVMSVSLNYSYSKDQMNLNQMTKFFKRTGRYYKSNQLEGFKIPQSMLGYLKFDLTFTVSAAHILDLLHGESLSQMKRAGLNERFSVQSKREFLRAHEKILKLKEKLERAFAKKDYKSMTSMLNSLFAKLLESEEHFKLFMQKSERPILLLTIEGERVKKTQLSL